MCDIWVPKCSLAPIQLGCWNFVYDTQQLRKGKKKGKYKYKSIRTHAPIWLFCVCVCVAKARQVKIQFTSNNKERRKAKTVNKGRKLSGIQSIDGL